MDRGELFDLTKFGPPPAWWVFLVMEDGTGAFITSNTHPGAYKFPTVDEGLRAVDSMLAGGLLRPESRVPVERYTVGDFTPVGDGGGTLN